ncbi:Protein fantom [Caenorhabditis elegans]|nr:Protein fantom [Caenorhabditis elegans]CAR97805.1 Protein fantom [Caenorhabditis elegans]|eukprot:NP_001254261.1 Protein fantom [Caenorhabditis elegans]
MSDDESGRSTPVIEEKKKPRRKSRKSSHQEPSKNPIPPPRIPDQTEKVLLDKLKVAENDLAMLQEECDLVKKANERLVHQSLSKSTEYGARESIEEKKKIVELEELLKETEKRIKESEHRRREDQKKFEAMRLHYKNKYDAAKKTEKKLSVVAKNSKVEEERIEEEKISHSPPPMTFEPIRKRHSQSEISRMRRADDDLLQKLYKEVADILHSHDVGIAEINTLGASENSLARWQKLYSELYEELEKVRNMLLIQYDINQKQMKEIKLLKDELDRLKTVSAEILSKSREEVEERQKKIFMLEEQIRTIAYSGQQPVKLLANQINIPTPRVNTDLSVKLINVKPSPSLTSKFFFSLEFFDFQLETTPIMDAKQHNMDFTTVYDVLVSNLLIHYLQTNGIVIEMYRPASDCYKLLAAATISLIPLFEDSVLRKFCSEIMLKSVDTGVEMCTLRYEIEVSQPISDSFKKFKKSEMARNMLPLQLENEDTEDTNFDPLTIMVNRVVGLDTFGKDPSTEFCIVDEFLSFSPYFTDFSTSSEIRSKRDCYIPKIDIARNLFATSSISFFLIENIPRQDGVIATLHLPLHPLCKLGGSIKGTFPMLDTDGRPSSVSLDLCLIWKHEIPSFFLKHEPKEPLKEVKDTPILPQPVRRTSKEFVVTPVKEAELHDAEPTSMPPKAPEPTTAPLRRLSTDSSDTSFSHSSKDLFSPPTNPQTYDYEIPAVTPALVDSDGEEEADRIVFDDDDDEIESVSAVSSQRDPEPLEVPERQVENLPSPEDTPRPSDPLKPNGTNESKESTPVTQRSVDKTDDVAPVDPELEPESGPEPEPVVESEPNEVAETEEDRKRELKTEELKSLLGALPPIAKPRNIPVGPIALTEQPEATRQQGSTGRILFTDPLHFSVPPSESSSTSSPRRAEKAPVPLPDYEGHSLIKVRKPLSPTDKDVLEPNMKVSIQLETFELVPGSSLTPLTREETTFFVDWVFLDFTNEQSKSTIFDFPRRPQEMVDIRYTKEYTLTRGQLSLLDQWIRASIKFELTIIKISPGDEEELGFGSLILVPNNTQNKSFVIDVYDRSGIVQAEMTLTLHFSRALIEQLT